MPKGCKREFMGKTGVGEREARQMAVNFARRHPVLRKRLAAPKRSAPGSVANLIGACDAVEFNPNACRVPVTIPYRTTVPRHQAQYALGRVETLLRAGYYHAGSCIRALNLDYHGNGLLWDIMVNDLFVACAAARKHPFGTFAIRIVLDPVVASPNLRRRALTSGHVVRTNVVQRQRTHVSTNKVQVDPGTVTAREICQLLKVFGMHLYAPRQQQGPYVIGFFSHLARIPKTHSGTWQRLEL